MFALKRYFVLFALTIFPVLGFADDNTYTIKDAFYRTDVTTDPKTNNSISSVKTYGPKGNLILEMTFNYNENMFLTIPHIIYFENRSEGKPVYVGQAGTQFNTILSVSLGLYDGDEAEYKFGFDKNNKFGLKKATTKTFNGKNSFVTTSYESKESRDAKRNYPYVITSINDNKEERLKATYYDSGDIASYSYYKDSQLTYIKYYPGAEHHVEKIELFDPTSASSTLTKQIFYSNDEENSVNKVVNIYNNGETNTANIYTVLDKNEVNCEEYENVNTIAAVPEHGAKRTHELLHINPSTDITDKITSAHNILKTLVKPSDFGFKLAYKPTDTEIIWNIPEKEKIKKSFLFKNFSASFLTSFGNDEATINQSLIKYIATSKKRGQSEFDVLFKTDLISYFAASYERSSGSNSRDALRLLIIEKIRQQYLGFLNTPIAPDATAAELALRKDIEEITDTAINHGDKHSDLKTLKELLKDIEVDELDYTTKEARELKAKYDNEIKFEERIDVK